MTAAVGARTRIAKSGDAGAIARVHVETWRDTYAGVLPEPRLVAMSVPSHEAMWSRVVGRRDEVVLVAEGDPGAVVGFGTCGPSRGARLPFVGEVLMLYVLPDHQGGGVGRELLTGLFRRLIRRGAGSALVWVLAANPARYFYQSLGGCLIAERAVSFWGAQVRECAYGWPDLKATVGEIDSRAASRPPD